MTTIPDARTTDPPQELEAARSAGTIDGIVVLGIIDDLPDLSVVRPIIRDAQPSWPSELSRLLASRTGAIVGVASEDPRLAAALACGYTAWSGDHGTESVLVDCSLESPVIDKPLLEDGDEGLVDAVLFGVSASAVARRTLARGVRVVTAGSRPLGIARALDSARLVQFARSLDAVLTVLVLPLRHLEYTLPAMDQLVLVGEDPAALVAAAAAARERGAARVLCACPARPPAAFLPEAGPTDGRETPAVEEAPLTQPDEGAPEQAPLLTETPGSEPSPLLTKTPGPEPSHLLTDAPGPEPSPFLAEDEPFVVAASLPKRSSRTRRPLAAAVMLLVAAAVIIWAWLGPAFRRGEATLQRGPSVVSRENHGATGSERPAMTEPEAVTDAGEATTADEGVSVPGGGPAAPEEGASTEAPMGHGSGDEPASLISGPGGPYVLYLSSQRVRSAAEYEVEEALKAGVKAIVVDAEIPDSGTWHRVAIEGGYPTLAEARNTLDIIRHLGYEGAWIARAPREE